MSIGKKRPSSGNDYRVLSMRELDNMLEDAEREEFWDAIGAGFNMIGAITLGVLAAYHPDKTGVLVGGIGSGILTAMSVYGMRCLYKSTGKRQELEEVVKEAENSRNPFDYDVAPKQYRKGRR